MQTRVRMQHDRLSELTAPGRRLTVAEAREIFALREQAARRRAHRAWLDRGDNRQYAVAKTRQWRSDNPGCW